MSPAPRGGAAASLQAQWGFADVRAFAESAVKSELFKNITDIDKAVVVIQMGMEIGVPPAASLKGIQIIDGKPEYAPALLLGVIENSGMGYVKLVRCDDEKCILQAYLVRPTGEYEAQEPIEFGKKEAAAITTWNYKKNKRESLLEKGSYANGYLSDMFFARCAGRIARRYFAAVTQGGVYGAGEISDSPDSIHGTDGPSGGEPLSASDATSGNTAKPKPSNSPKAKSVERPEPAAEAPILTVDPALPDITPNDESTPEYAAWRFRLSRGKKELVGNVKGKELATYYNNHKENIPEEEATAIKLIIKYKQAQSKLIKQKLAAEAASNQTEGVSDKVLEVFPGAEVEAVYGPIDPSKLGQTKMVGSAKYQGLTWAQIDPEYLEAFVKKNASLLPEGYAEDVQRYLNWKAEEEAKRLAEIESDQIPEFDADQGEGEFQEP